MSLTEKQEGGDQTRPTVNPPASSSSPAPPPPPQTAITYVRSFFPENFAASFIGGGVAGAVSRTVVSPLERLKILFQVQGPANQTYQGVGPALAKMWREEGWRGFMRGNGTNCVRIVPYSAVQFSSYRVYKKALADEAGNLTQFRSFIAGGFAGMTSVAVTYPLDIVRTRLSIQSASFEALGKSSRELPGMFTAIKMMYKTEGGMIALYRGLLPTLGGVAPYVGINFMTYEALRKYVTPEGADNPTPLGKLLAGGVSGALAQTITYPFDVLRRRFQVNTMNGIGYEYKGLWDAIRIIFRQEGPKGFYKGLLPNLLKVAPSMGASFLSYEITRDLLNGFTGGSV